MKMLVVAAIAGLLTTSISVIPSPARAWIDDPLPGAVLDVGSVEIVAHAFDPAGVATVVISVDGDPIAEVSPAAPGDRFVIVRTQWDPPGPGTYLLRAQGRSTGGDAGAAASAVIEIEGTAPSTTTTTTAVPSPTTTTAPPSTTTTQPPTTTTTQPPITTTTSTSTTTTTSCDLGMPAPTGPTGSVSTPSPTLTWSYNGCREPFDFEIQVSRDSTFTRVELDVNAPGTVRNLAVGPLSCDTWFWRIRTLDVDTGPFSGVVSFTVIGRLGC